MTIIAGIDLDSLDIDNTEFVYPDVVPGRLLNADGDILAYNCAGNDETTRDEVLFNLDAEIKNLMAVAGADHYVLHLTGTGSDKGYRHSVATVKEYQANRKDKPKPKNLAWVRQYMLTNMNAIAHMEQEADDGLAQTQQEYIDNGQSELCVLWSTDKDLRMVQGLHIDPDTGKLVDVQGYGECWYVPEKAKTIGWGTSFFWHQMLMGDTADNIPGLDKFSQEISIAYWPTAPLKEARRRIEEGTMPSGKPLTDKQRDKATADCLKILDEYKEKPCGAVAVTEYLSECTSDQEAFEQVARAYKERYGDAYSYTDWSGRDLTRSWKQMMYEQAILLWMRRSPGHTDFINLFKTLDWEKLDA